LEDERDAVQSQAHLLMFEQEKELIAGLRVLEETREKLLTLVQTCKERFRAQEEV
jgi:predicted GNAT family N-acyltransferase